MVRTGAHMRQFWMQGAPKLDPSTGQQVWRGVRIRVRVRTNNI